VRIPALAPFQIRSFRFQWPADLLTSWAFEMEGVILGWFVLVSTGSVTALAVFGSLQFLGTLVSPFFGMAGDRIGNRNVLCLMRIIYVGIAFCLMTLFLSGLATPVAIFILAAIMGLVRPSDITLRNLLVGETMPAELLMRAMSVSRMTADSARIVGALSGATLMATLGSGIAYVVICCVYGTSFLLSLNVGIKRLRVLGEEAIPMSPVRALKEGFAYVWSTPDVRAATLLAFLMNLTAFPLVNALLAHVAKDIYGLDRPVLAG
jgi:MFS family permease